MPVFATSVIFGVFAVPAFSTGIYRLNNTCPNPDFHGSVILSYIFKTTCCMNIILLDSVAIQVTVTYISWYSNFAHNHLHFY